MNVSLDNTQQMLEIKNLDEILKELPVAKTIVRKMQLDPRNDPESLYMLLAGVENLEQLLGGESNESFAAKSHKVGALSQGFMVVNEIQRLHLSLLESLMGFLEDPQGIKYNLAGETVYVDGAIIFTSNSPLTVFGEESQPIINRVPEVLWPARDVKNRVEIVKDMFEDHMVTSKVSITSNPSLIKMFETNGKSEKDFISRLALEFISNVSNDSIPPSLKSTSARSENRVARSDFYNGLDEIHNPRLFRLKQLTLPWRFSIVHLSGDTNSAADAISRYSTTHDPDAQIFSEEEEAEVSAIKFSMQSDLTVSWDGMVSHTQQDPDLRAQGIL